MFSIEFNVNSENLDDTWDKIQDIVNAKAIQETRFFEEDREDYLFVKIVYETEDSSPEDKFEDFCDYLKEELKNNEIEYSDVKYNR